MPARDRRRVLSTPAISVGTDSVAIVPNSASFTTPPEINVRSMSGGGLSFEVVAGTDASTLISTVKFEMATTSENINRVADWKNASALTIPVTILVVEETDQFSFSEMYLSNAPDVALESEGNVEVEFMGRIDLIQ